MWLLIWLMIAVYVYLCDIGCTRICNCHGCQLFHFTSMMGGASLVIVDIDLSSWTLLLVIDSLGSFMLLSSAESVSSVA